MIIIIIIIIIITIIIIFERGECEQLLNFIVWGQKLNPYHTVPVDHVLFQYCMTQLTIMMA